MNKVALILGILFISAIAAEDAVTTPPMASEYISTLDRLDSIESKVDIIDKEMKTVSNFAVRLSSLDREIQAKIEDFYREIRSTVETAKRNMIIFAVILVGIVIIAMGALGLFMHTIVKKSVEYSFKTEIEPAIYTILNSNYYTVNEKPKIGKQETVQVPPEGNKAVNAKFLQPVQKKAVIDKNHKPKKEGNILDEIKIIPSVLPEAEDRPLIIIKPIEFTADDTRVYTVPKKKRFLFW
jgi:hypothetical protein